MKQQKIIRNVQPKTATVIDERKQTVDSPDVAIRTVLYVEVRDMPSEQVTQLVGMINENYKESRGGIHYVLPVRHGVIGSDIFFEQEWLSVINKICEVNQSGEIVLKDGAKSIRVTREYVND